MDENTLAQVEGAILVDQTVRQAIEVKADAFDPLDVALSDREFDEGLVALAQWLLFETRYDPQVLVKPSLLKRIPSIDSLPLVCKAEECPYHDNCPIMIRASQAQKDDLKGKLCRREREYAIRVFCDLAKELEVGPQHTIDLMTLSQLVRAHVGLQRTDWQIQLDGIMEEEPAVIDQRTGQVYWKRGNHPLHKLQESYTKTIASLHSQLMASRKDRAALAAAMGDKETLFRALLTGKIGNQRGGPAAPPRLAPQNVQDAEFREEEDEDEDDE